MPLTVAFAPVQPTDGDGRVGAALSHIGWKSPRRMAVILKLSGLLANFDTAGEFPLSNFGHQCLELRASCRCQIGAAEPSGHPDQVHRCRSRDVLEVGLGVTDIP